VRRSGGRAWTVGRAFIAHIYFILIFYEKNKKFLSDSFAYFFISR